MSSPLGRFEGYGVPPRDPGHSDRDGAATAPGSPGAPGEGRGNRLPWAIGGAVLLLLLVGAAVWFQRSPAGVLGRAVVTTLDAGSARTRITATVGGVPLLGEVEVGVAEGVLDFGSGQASLSRELLNGDETELRYVDDGVYLRVPVADDRWIRLSESEIDAGTDVTAVAPGIGNPIALLGLLRVILTEPREIGTSSVDGEPVTVYEVVVDLEDAATLSGNETRTLVRRLQRLTGNRALPVRVGVDEGRHIRFIAFSATLELSRLLSPRLDNRIEFSDFGVEVDVQTPSADRLVDVDPSQLADLDVLEILRNLIGEGLRGAEGLVSRAAVPAPRAGAALSPPEVVPGTPG